MDSKNYQLSARKLFSIIFMLLCLITISCHESKENTAEQEDISTVPIEEPVYEGSSYSYTLAIPQQETASQPSDQAVRKSEQTIAPSAAPAPQSVDISAAYLEGYDNGYEDGEDDAVNHSGWQDQYDDSNGYKGKMRKDYEEGYADGYEAGYDDNMSDYDE